MKRTFQFNTQAEADAYANGVEWVNDSAIELISKEQKGNQWVLTYKDDNATEPQE